MIYLFLAILCSTTILLVFKLFERYDIDNFQAIIYNYIVCVIVGKLVLGNLLPEGNLLSQPWLPYAAILGVVFIGGFQLAAITVQQFGITIATVMQRMSLIITVPYVIYTFQESLTLLKILGILLAFTAVIFSNLPDKSSSNTTPTIKHKYLWLVPISVLLMSGFIESMIQYAQVRVLGESFNQIRFTTFIFGTAAAIGFVILLFNLLTKRMTFHWRHVVGGIALGVPNFGSIYFLLMVLKTGWEGSVVFPLTNVGVIVASSVLAVILFREGLNRWKIIGVIAAVLAIVLIAIS